MARRKKPEGFPVFVIRPGDRVLFGTYGITMPADWIHASVLWVGDEDCLLEHSDLSGHTVYRQVVDLTAIRAVGEYADLREFKARARGDFAEKCEAVAAAQEATEQARRAMWTALDRVGAASADLRKSSIFEPVRAKRSPTDTCEAL